MEELKFYIDYGIIGTLGVMGFASLFIYIERLFFLGSIDVKKYGSIDELELELGGGISWIATIGSNAPYVGLLGTVLGIMLTFYTMGEIGVVETKVVMTGLALALKATAMGLIIAIPSIVFYNHLVRKIEVLLIRWKRFYGA